MPAARLQPYADHLGSALAERFSAETVASGLATAAAGTAAAAAVSAAWWCSGAAFESARAQCCSTYVVSSRSQVFAWMKVWLSVQPEFRQTTQTTAVQLAEELDKGLLANEDGSPGELGFSAADQSTHWFRHHGALLSISLRRERTAGHQDKEELVLILHGWPWPGSSEARRAQLVSLVEEARQQHVAQTRGRTELFIGQPEYSTWESIGTRRSRTLESVILPQGLAEDFMADARRFKASAGWYADRGIPYRRGYLIYGTPGSGKTSLITAMAGELRLNICILNLSDPMLDDGKLLELMAEVPSDSVVVLEDVDAAFNQVLRKRTFLRHFLPRQARDKHTESAHSKEMRCLQREHAKSGGASSTITFSGLLNAIDGVAAQEGRLLCLTTNHVDRLDPALIRPGASAIYCLLSTVYCILPTAYCLHCLHCLLYTVYCLPLSLSLDH
jgi:chaperone BCS1